MSVDGNADTATSRDTHAQLDTFAKKEFNHT